MKFIKILLLVNILIIFNCSYQYGQYLSENVSLLGRIGDARNSGMCIYNNNAFIGGGCYLYIFDITDNSAPKLLSKILTPSKIESIKIFGQYALIANSAAGLSIINISDIRNPIFIISCKTKTIARDIDIFNNYAFVSDVYYGFVVIDISNIQNPHEIFAYQSEGGEKIKIKGNNLYFCNNYNGLKIFDISNPFSPVLKSSFTQCNSAEAIEFYKNFAILSDQYYGIYILNLTNINDIQVISQLPITRIDRQLALCGDSIYVCGLYSNVNIIDVSDVGNPKIARQYNIVRYTKNIEIVNDNLFLLNVDTGLEVYDKKEDNKMLFSYSMPSYMREFDFYDHYIAIAYQYAGVIMYDINDSHNLNLVSTFSYKNAVNDFDKEMNKVINIGNLCFMFTAYNGVSIYDISNPYAPQYLSYLQKEDGSPNTANSIAKIKDSIYYLITGKEIAIYDLTNPRTPLLVKSIPLELGNRIIVEGSNAFITNWDSNGNYKLYVYDVSDYLNPIQNSVLDLQYYPNGIDIKDNIIYAACTNGGLFVIDVADKYNPFIKETIYYGNHSMSYVCVSDNYLYVTDGINGLLVFDITNNDNIKLVGQFNFGNYAYYVKEYQGKIYVSSFEDGLYIFQNDLITSVFNQQLEVPSDYLLQNFPNPFNPTTTISFGLSKKQSVSLKVYNILGEEVATLLNEEMSSGIHEVKFDGNNLASGIYIYSIKTPSYSVSKKMILTK